MKKAEILGITLWLLQAIALPAQQDVKLPGVVVEQNSQFNTGTLRTLSGATVVASRFGTADAQTNISTKSDALGKFTLVFADIPTGELVDVHASKYGYELINEKELKSAAVTDRKTPLKVVMCLQGKKDENQMVYYGIANDAYFIAYNKKLAILDQEGKEKDKLMAELRLTFNMKIADADEAKALLATQLQSAKQQAKDLADKFVTINLDDQCETYQRAFRAFLGKDIDLAIRIMNSVDLKGRLEMNAAIVNTSDAIIQNQQVIRGSAQIQIKQDIEQAVLNARLHKLNFHFHEADSLYELALEHDKLDHSIAWEYVVFLQEQNQFMQATGIYSSLLNQFRQLADSFPQIYLPYVATTLNNFGGVLSDNSEMVQARAVYEEALKIRRELASKNPDVYLPDVAATLNNLGLLLRDINEMAGARAACQEALKVYRESALKDPVAYLPNMAGTLTNLGALFSENNEMARAQASYEEALKILRELVRKNPDAYLPNLAGLLNNLGALLSGTNETTRAQASYEEALKILRALARKNPDAYLPNMARTLNNLGASLSANNEMARAQASYEEALKIFQELAGKNPDAYLGDIAGTLNNLGNLLKESNEMARARVFYEEALKAYRELVRKNPNAYLPDLAMTLNNFGLLSYQAGETTRAAQQLEEALRIREKLFYTTPKAYGIDASQSVLGLVLVYDALLESTGDLAHRVKGLKLLEEARKFLSVYNDPIPQVIQNQQMIKEFAQEFQAYRIEDHANSQQLSRLEAEVDAAVTPHEKVLRQQEIITQLEVMLSKDPENPKLSALLPSKFGSLAWHQLFDQNFAAAEAAARKGLQLAPEETWIETNLALALLYQGRWEEAKEIYTRLKDQPHNDAIYAKTLLEDLDALEKTGITHPDVERARRLLR